MNKEKNHEKSGALRAAALQCLFWLAVLLYLELVLHFWFFGAPSWSWLYAVCFTAVIALGITCLTGFLPRRANQIVTMVLVSLLSVLYCSQVCYEAAFGTMYSMSQMGLGGAMLTNFLKETVLTILDNIPILLVLLLPIPAAAICLRSKTLFGPGRHWLRLLLVPMAAILQVAALCCLPLGGTGDYTNYYFYHDANATTDQTAERFGLLTTMRVEFTSGTGAEKTEEAPLPSFAPVPEATKPVQLPEDPTAPTDTTPVKAYNVLEIDFDYLNTLTEDKAILALNQYIASLPGTKTNEYTGMLADYNLITICAESFSTAAIQKDLTPTLYRLANEGFVFNNYYNSYPNTTTDGEYSFCLGLWPDTSRGKSVASFYASRDSYLPFALGNVYQEQLGIQSYAYHNYKGSYYGREQTHPNMGYACKFAGSGMEFDSGWPSSDLEMMEQSIGDYLYSGQQFHAYYMTYSGHYKYVPYNPMAYRNYDTVKDLPYSETAKCYLACNLELEKAVTYLMEELERAGIADKTAIVLAGDHFPYGLEDSDYEDLIGYEIDHFSQYKSTLIFWVGGMEETVYVDDYMCNIDILPTILNLWGFSYDSRLMAGTDIFSDSEHIAILRDQSFLTDKVWFNASKGKTVWQVDEAAVPADYLENHINMVKNQFAVSSSILNEAYYNFLFEKGEVDIEYDNWRGESNADADQDGDDGNTGEDTGGNAGDGTGENTGDGTGENAGGDAPENPEEETVPA